MSQRQRRITIFEEPTTSDSPLVFQAQFRRRRKGCRTVLDGPCPSSEPIRTFRWGDGGRR
jgi:hypothetical protein